VLRQTSKLTKLEIDIDGRATDGNQAVEVVVLAANGLSIAGSSRTNSNNVDGGTADSEGNSDSLEKDAQSSQEGGSGH